MKNQKELIDDPVPDAVDIIYRRDEVLSMQEDKREKWSKSFVYITVSRTRSGKDGWRSTLDPRNNRPPINRFRTLRTNSGVRFNLWTNIKMRAIVRSRQIVVR
ncbi:hypothetical protein E2C01_043536 [Portunus trituberculatus]|uniref:Uncharacterized protein n=1 Tax=Portunus trituberculatus TaxID=210409 RepID=A0A5B7FXK6_PORTR|nr:hypothetical protein [Portunus trituberculatus]